MESTVNLKLDFDGLNKIMKACDFLNSTQVRSGVLNGDSETLKKAHLNEKGGLSVYDRGPYAGETVMVPPRSFVRAPAEHSAKDAFEKASKALSNGFTENNMNRAFDIIGKEISDAQRKAIETNGEGANPDWLKHNEPRTVATKGFDKPLYTVNNETFPIDYEVVR